MGELDELASWNVLKERDELNAWNDLDAMNALGKLNDFDILDVAFLQHICILFECLFPPGLT